MKVPFFEPMELFCASGYLSNDYILPAALAGQINGLNEETFTMELAGTEHHIRRASPEDAPAIYRLVKECEAVDSNSLYMYAMWLKEFADYNLVVEKQGQVVAFVTAFSKPSQPDCLFIWQLVARPRHGIPHLGVRMMSRLVDKARARGMKAIEATISKQNRAVLGVIRKIARLNDATLSESLYLSSDWLSVDDDHDDEHLVTLTF